MTVDDESTRTRQVKSSLRRLAGPDDRSLIERAVTAVENLADAAAFLEAFDLGELETAIEATDDTEVATRGRRALYEFRRFQRAAAGEGRLDHFHPGRGTDLRRDDESPIR